MRERLAAPTSAAGRVLLAHRQPWRDNILHPRRAPTNPALTNRAELELDAVRIRQRGYAINDNDPDQPGTLHTAAPIHSTHTTPAAIAITIPQPDGDDPIAGLIEQVTSAAAALTRDLTHADQRRPHKPR